MNKQISRRNLIKLLGVSGVTLPLSGLAGSETSISKIIKKDAQPIKLSSNENPYGPSDKVRQAIIDSFDEGV